MTTKALSGTSSAITRRLRQGTGVFLLAALFIDAGLFMAGVTPLLIPGSWLGESGTRLLLLTLFGAAVYIAIRERPRQHKARFLLALFLGSIVTVALGFALVPAAKDDAVRFACEQAFEQENAITACLAKATLSLVDSAPGSYWVEVAEPDGVYTYRLAKYHHDGSRLFNLIEGHQTHFVVQEKRKQLEPGAPAITP